MQLGIDRSVADLPAVQLELEYNSESETSIMIEVNEVFNRVKVR
jgi:hypothetical protein